VRYEKDIAVKTRNLGRNPKISLSATFQSGTAKRREVSGIPDPGKNCSVSVPNRRSIE